MLWVCAAVQISLLESMSNFVNRAPVVEDSIDARESCPEIDSSAMPPVPMARETLLSCVELVPRCSGVSGVGPKRLPQYDFPGEGSARRRVSPVPRDLSAMPLQVEQISPAVACRQRI